MPIDYDQMRDCLLDALSQHVLSLDSRAEVIISGAFLKARTQSSAAMQGLLDGATAFGPGDDKLFEQALWTLFSEGTLAPVFKAQRYGRGGWEEGEFKLTARGMRGFRAGASPRTDLESYLSGLTFASAGLTRGHAVVAYAEQAARAARAELHLAGAVMVGLALETAVDELLAAFPAPVPPGLSLMERLAWLDGAMRDDPEAARALALAPEVADGVAPLLAGAPAVVGAHLQPAAGGIPVAAGPQVEAALVALTPCVERAGLLTRALRVRTLS